MKKWSGGMMIVALAIILLISYNFMGIKPRKQSAYSFFNDHPKKDSLKKESGDIAVPSEKEVKEIPKPSKNHHLVHVEGLNDLYGLHNISGETKALLVWANLRALLSRSDALPETAQGVKEASIAWKDLVSSIEEKSSKVGYSKEQGNMNCLFCVNTQDEKALADGLILELPCGLVEDSSISMVGIPDGPFQIELLGSLLSGEPKPPVILHYNVSPSGDNITEDPFIVQNTWTKELGWGNEERCPSDRPTNDLKVDGLVLCNQHIFRSSKEANINISQTSSDMLSNVSRGSDHASFPFVEVIPFIATIWAGLEGFHMTVNGRHETSFAYREKLEPWSVSKVKATGGFSLLSALAKGLPVSEDHDLVVDVESLKAPPVGKKRLVMLVGVFSTGNNFERRMALRRSWMQYEAVRSGDVAVQFFIGLHKNKQVNYELWREAQVYGDVQLMPFVDYYSLISLKTIALCIMGCLILPVSLSS